MQNRTVDNSIIIARGSFSVRPPLLAVQLPEQLRKIRRKFLTPFGAKSSDYRRAELLAEHFSPRTKPRLNQTSSLPFILSFISAII